MVIIATKRKSGTRKAVQKKICPTCQKEKPISTGFYKSSSPMFSADGCVPICVTCVKNYVVDERGVIDNKRLKIMLQRLDKPLYYDDLDAAYSQFRKKHEYMSTSDIMKNGKNVVAIYFKNINSLKQNKNKTFHDSEQENFIHSNGKFTGAEREELIRKYSDDNEVNITIKSEPETNSDNIGYTVTNDDVQLFGEGFSNAEYRKMRKKYENLKINYSLQTNLHQEALATYVRFKVKEEDATARGEVDEAKKWYDAAQNAAANGKLTPKQLSESDLQGGINCFSEIFKAVEQAVDVIPILPRFKYRPNDALDFNIWCYINYARDLEGKPQCSYEDVYKFYDKKKQEYLDQYGDPYGIFDDEPDKSIRDSIKKFITLPKDYDNGEV